MIEIRTQADFNALQTTITNTPTDGELIRIYPIEGDVAYTMSTNIKITRSNVFIEGVGMPTIQSALTLSTAVDGSMFNISGTGNTIDTRLGNITIRGLNLKGTGSGGAGYHGIYISQAGFAQEGILATGSDTRFNNATIGNTLLTKAGVTIQDCVIESMPQYGIYLTDSAMCRVLDSIIKNNVYNVGLYGSYDCMVHDNTITGATNASGDGVTMSNTTAYGCRYNSIAGNTILNNARNGVFINGATTAISMCNLIVDNHIANNASNGVLVSSYVEMTVIAGNTVANNATYGVYTAGTGTSKGVICGNNAVNNTSSGVFVNTPADYFAVSLNTVKANNSSGIRLSVSYTPVFGNTVAHNTADGIYTSGGTYTAVAGNTATGNSGYGVNAGTSNYVCTYGNTLRGNVGGGFTGSGTGGNYDTNANII